MAQGVGEPMHAPDVTVSSAPPAVEEGFDDNDRHEFLRVFERQFAVAVEGSPPEALPISREVEDFGYEPPLHLDDSDPAYEPPLYLDDAELVDQALVAEPSAPAVVEDVQQDTVGSVITVFGCR